MEGPKRNLNKIYVVSKIGCIISIININSYKKE